MVGRFEGKVVIVTGSSNGIGRATAVLFAEEGAKVTITGRDDKALAETRKEMQAVGAKKDDIVAVQGDLIDEVIQKKIIDATIEQFGKIDILVGSDDQFLFVLQASNQTATPMGPMSWWSGYGKVGMEQKRMLRKKNW
ncbi:unnamed protein product [Haemonchus placei]|uniref:Short chain dehydrogenase n=1 Tax=Haemonchus placei TaxID=6290 RepID=A0A0N4X9E2_HAEPC|nr:unnamed protein product [Haemonchus placei]